MLIKLATISLNFLNEWKQRLDICLNILHLYRQFLNILFCKDNFWKIYLSFLKKILNKLQVKDFFPEKNIGGGRGISFKVHPFFQKYPHCFFCFCCHFWTSFYSPSREWKWRRTWKKPLADLEARMSRKIENIIFADRLLFWLCCQLKTEAKGFPRFLTQKFITCHCKNWWESRIAR